MRVGHSCSDIELEVPMILNVITTQLNDSALADHNDGLVQDIVKHGVVTPDASGLCFNGQFAELRTLTRIV